MWQFAFLLFFVSFCIVAGIMRHEITFAEIKKLLGV